MLMPYLPQLLLRPSPVNPIHANGLIVVRAICFNITKPKFSELISREIMPTLGFKILI